MGNHGWVTYQYELWLLFHDLSEPTELKRADLCVVIFGAILQGFARNGEYICLINFYPVADAR